MSTAFLKAGHNETMYTLDSSSSNIPSAYSSAAGSAVRKTPGPPKHHNFAFVNYTAAAIAISLDGGTTDAFMVPASNSSGPSVIVIENVALGNNTSIRSLSGSAISSGVVYLMVW